MEKKIEDIMKILKEKTVDKVTLKNRYNFKILQAQNRLKTVTCDERKKNEMS